MLNERSVEIVVTVDALGLPVEYIKGNKVPKFQGTNLWTLIAGDIVFPFLNMGSLGDFSVIMASGKGIIAENDEGKGVVAYPCPSSDKAIIAVHDRDIDPGLLLLSLQELC